MARGPEGRGGGRGEGGRPVVHHLPVLRGWPVAPGPVPLLLRRILPWYTCSAGVAGQPRAPGAAWPAVSGSAWQGGRVCQCAVPPGAHPGGPVGRGAGRSLCRGLFPRLLRAGSKAGLFVCAPPSMRHSRVSPSRCGPRGALERRRRAAGRLRALME